jgi:zinc protease
MSPPVSAPRADRVRLRPSRPPALVLLFTPVLLAAPGAFASPVTAQPATLDVVLRDTTLENGLQVIVVPNPTVPLVTIQVTIRNGAFTQLTGPEEGVPHLLEHMLFRSYGGSGFGQAAYALDGYYNGTTGDETVTYYMTLPSSNLDRGVRLLADLMRAPRFERDALISEQRVVTNEMERAASDPGFMFGYMVDQRVWGEAHGRKNAIGRMQSIQRATPALLKQMYDRFYVPNNAAVVFAGDVSPAAAFESAARHFARWRRGADPFGDLALPPIPPLVQNQVVVVDMDAQDVTLLIRWQGPSVRTDRAATFAADLFSAIVNDPVSDFQARLVDSGLFQSVTMNYLTRAHVGPISIHATTTVDQLWDASRALRQELDRFADPDFVTPELLAVARKRQEVEWAMAMETPSGLAEFVGELWSVADLDYVREYVGALQAQRKEDLDRYVVTWLTGRPRVTGIMASAATRSELGSRLGAAVAPWRR